MKFKVGDLFYSPIHCEYGFVCEIEKQPLNKYGGTQKIMIVDFFVFGKAQIAVGSIIYQSFEKLNET